MILQQLCADAEHLLPDMAPSMYDRKPVQWLIDLNEDGRLNGFVPLTGEEKGGKSMLVPFLIRPGTGIRALLLADRPAYVLGLADDHRVAAKHEAFKELVQACHEATGSEAVHAVDLFLRSWDPMAHPAPEEMTPKDLLTFRVGDLLPIDLPEVRAFWAERCTRQPGSGDMECLVCGALGPVEVSLPLPLKGIPGGQTSGTALVSANAKAFESYGLDRAQTSPICKACGEVSHKALNALLSGPRTQLRVGPVKYVFWASHSDYSPLDDLDQPDPESVQRLIDAYRTGRPDTDIDASAFHAIALSASGGRAVVRDWLQTTVGSVKRNLGRWFAWQRIVDPYGELGRPFGIYRLAAGLYRDASKEMPALVPQLLTRAALNGAPLPDALVVQALKRNHAEGAVTYARAALIKAVLASHLDTTEVGERMIELETKNQEHAYLCGRLLAELEEIQRRAIPGINATLVDRYFGTASTAPASVFGRLLSGAQPHLAKLRKSSEGAYHGAQARLESIMEPLGGFPAVLTLKQQALFSLGYYHQRAATRTAKAEAKARKTEQRDAPALFEEPAEETQR